MKKMKKNEKKWENMKKHEKTWKKMRFWEILRKKKETYHVAHKFFSFQINLVQTTKFILLHSVCRGIGVQHYIFSLYLLIIW